MTPQKKISIVSPVYNAEFILIELISRITQALECNFDSFEIILVDDSSVDQSWETIKLLQKKHPYIRAIQLKQNVGQHLTIKEGLKLAQGEFIIVMDCDLQDEPEQIKTLFENCRGFDYCLAAREKRQDSKINIFTSALFYQVLQLFWNIKIKASTVNFGCFTFHTIQKVLNASPYSYFPLAVAQTKGNATCINVQHKPRKEGDSNYNLYTRTLLTFRIFRSLSNGKVNLFFSILVLFQISFLTSLGIIIYSYHQLSYSILILFTFLIAVFTYSSIKSLNLAFRSAKEIIPEIKEII